MKPHYVSVIFQKILQLMTWRKKGVSKLSFFVDYNAIDTSDINRFRYQQIFNEWKII